MRDYERTTGRVIAGQPVPEPVRPPGDGWQLLSTVPGKDADGHPCLQWTWFKTITQEDPAVEELTQ